MFNRINLKLPRFTHRIFIFLIFGLVVLVLIAEGVYWVRLKKEECPLTSKPSAILGEELAVENKNQVEVKEGNVVINLESSVGVREYGDGTIGIAGFVVELVGDEYLTLQIKNKNIKLNIIPQTGIAKTKSKFPEKERPIIEDASLDDIKKNMYVDVLCEQAGDLLEAKGILIYY